MSWLAMLWSLARGAPTWLLGALGALAAAAFAYLRGRSAGKAAERQRSTEAVLERKAEAERLEREIERLPADELERRGGPWVRR